jgi:hypothetical protein
VKQKGENRSRLKIIQIVFHEKLAKNLAIEKNIKYIFQKIENYTNIFLEKQKEYLQRLIFSKFLFFDFFHLSMDLVTLNMSEL